MLDISTDIDVLEQLLKRDGFTDNEILQTARTAAEAQMRVSSVPVMNFADAAASDQPESAQSAARLDNNDSGK